MTAVAVYRFRHHVLLWLGVLLILMARVPLLWQSGEFVSEDGWVFFAEAFNAPWSQSLFTPFAGYFRLEARLIAEGLSFLPWAWQPPAYALVGLGLNALVFSLFYLPGFRPVLASDARRLAVVVLLALAPNAENLGLLTGLHWYLSFALALLLVMDPPRRRAGRIVLVVASSLCIWSSPSALVLLPFFALRWLKGTDRFGRRWSAVVVVQLVLYAVTILALRGSEGTRSGDFDRGAVFAAIEHLMVRGWLVVGVWGHGLAERLVRASPWAVDLLGVSTLVALGWLMWRTRRIREIGPGLLIVIAALMLVFSLTRTLYIGELADRDLPRHVRYLTAPTLLLFVALWGLVARRVADPRSRWWWILAGGQAVALLVGIPAAPHWARPAGDFRFQDHIPAIVAFERDYLKPNRPGSLYLPNDVPYWGPVLESAGGELHRPEDGLLRALEAEEGPDGWVDSWFGSFRVLEGNKRIEHEHWGRLTFTGIELGRIWFVDPAGRQLFTSPLLYPHAWIVEGPQMILLNPPH